MAGLATLAVAAGAFVATAPAASAAPADDWLAQINQVRSSRGVAPLTIDPQASQVAEAWTDRMAGSGTLAHNPSYASQITTQWRSVGENVGYGGSITTVMNAFVGSSGHLANLVNPAYNRVGVGQTVVNGRMWTTHDFVNAVAGPYVTPTTTAPKKATRTKRTMCNRLRPSCVRSTVTVGTQRFVR